MNDSPGLVSHSVTSHIHWATLSLRCGACALQHLPAHVNHDSASVTAPLVKRKGKYEGGNHHQMPHIQHVHSQ